MRARWAIAAAAAAAAVGVVAAAEGDRSAAANGAAVAAGVGAAVPGGVPADGAAGANGRAAGAGGTPGVCELERADRARTPSHVCMQCHDGTAGAAVAFSMRADGNGMVHPVAVDYASAEARFPGKYRPRHTLPASVPLVNGRVECTTCHDGASPDPKRVVMHPRLCTSCHDL